ncbi:MAG TPA: acyltransferase [Myxococcales bacterium]|nr:acyltransferase [Myxococcales bacterium]
MDPGTAEEPPQARPFLARFRRVTTSGGFIAEIDGLRFIAIFVVVVFHVAAGLMVRDPVRFAPQRHGLIGAMAWNGFRGVELFFVISGFILGLPFAAHALQGKPRVDLKQYLLRRVTRLEPPYVLCMILLFALQVLVRHREAGALLPHLGASLLYLHNLIYAAESPINNVAWSLEVEIQFYLLAPALAALFLIRGKARRRAAIVALCASSVLLGWLFIEPGQRAYLSILRFGHFFLIGFLLADVYLTDWRERPVRRWSWDLVSIAGWPLLFLFLSGTAQPAPGQAPGHEPALTTFGFPVAVFFLYCAAFQGRLTNRILVNGWITTIGGMCYTIYLLHNPALALILDRTQHLPATGFYQLDLVLQVAVAAPLILAPSLVYFALIEKPCMRRDWPRRLLARSYSRPAFTTFR